MVRCPAPASSEPNSRQAKRFGARRNYIASALGACQQVSQRSGVASRYFGGGFTVILRLFVGVLSGSICQICAQPLLRFWRLRRCRGSKTMLHTRRQGTRPKFNPRGKRGVLEPPYGRTCRIHMYICIWTLSVCRHNGFKGFVLSDSRYTP